MLRSFPTNQPKTVLINNHETSKQTLIFFSTITNLKYFFNSTNFFTKFLHLDNDQ